MTVVQTKFAGRSPFKPKKPRNPPKPVNLAVVAIVDDPLPPGRAKRSAERKYDALFDAMKPGQGLKCEPADVGKIAHAMSGWIKRQGLRDHVARSTKDYEGDAVTKGRVWLVKLGKKGGA